MNNTNMTEVKLSNPCIAPEKFSFLTRYNINIEKNRNAR